MQDYPTSDGFILVKHVTIIIIIIIIIIILCPPVSVTPDANQIISNDRMKAIRTHREHLRQFKWGSSKTMIEVQWKAVDEL